MQVAGQVAGQVTGRVLASVMAALLAAAAPKGPVSGEHLAAPPAPGFVIGFSAANAIQSIREEVPKGETVEVWTRMITTQRFASLAQQTTPADYLAIIAKSLAQNCPGGKAAPVEALTVSDRPAARMRATCPLLAQTGKPETFFMLAVAGKNDMHVKQIAFRRVPSAADEAYAATFLSSVRLCGGTGTAAGC